MIDDKLEYLLKSDEELTHQLQNVPEGYRIFSVIHIGPGALKYRVILHKIKPVSTDVTVTVVVPKQKFEFTYLRVDWDNAYNDGQIDDLMDHDISDMDVDHYVIDPDGDGREIL